MKGGQKCLQVLNNGNNFNNQNNQDANNKHMNYFIGIWGNGSPIPQITGTTACEGLVAVIFT
ncbi:hypothetical protein AHX51_26805 [Salmonella enterica subsp. diarizonae]|nr:hypothetical protein [Salmonella enterica subsp. diarizonae]